MPDLNQELEHLTLADSHIADAEKLIARVKQQIDRGIEQGYDATQAKISLEAMLETLKLFIEHRDSIAQTIENIRSGKFGDSQ